MKRIKVGQFKDDKLLNSYDSFTEAANAVGGQESHVSECARKVIHRNTHKGYEWRLLSVGGKNNG